MRVLVCGGRDYPDQARVWKTLQEIHDETPIERIIQGGATGADAWAMTWGHTAEVPVRTYEADWKKFGRRAGPIRNQVMLEEQSPTLVVAFPGGKGTADMVRRALKAGITTMQIGAPT